MGCIPFCCCCANFTPRTFDIIALACNIIKVIISLISLFAILWAVLLAASLFSFLEIAFTITNLVHTSVILCHFCQNEAFGKYNKCDKTLCMVSLVFSGIIIALRLLTLILIIAIASETGGGFWAGFIITFLLFLSIEVIHFIALNYLYKLLSLKADCSYNDYNNKIGIPVNQNSATVTNIYNNNPPMFPPNMSQPGLPNNLQTPPSNVVITLSNNK